MSMTATHGGGPSFGQAFSNATSITCSTGWSMYGMSGIRARPAPRHRSQVTSTRLTSAQRGAEAAGYGRTD
eukprot:scaffold82237_cov63-Phaeocystis_antarctica.AAC.2